MGSVCNKLTDEREPISASCTQTPICCPPFAGGLHVGGAGEVVVQHLRYTRNLRRADLSPIPEMLMRVDDLRVWLASCSAGGQSASGSGVEKVAAIHAWPDHTVPGQSPC